jgi:hypothetical protein
MEEVPFLPLGTFRQGQVSLAGFSSPRQLLRQGGSVGSFSSRSPFERLSEAQPLPETSCPWRLRSLSSVCRVI